MASVEALVFIFSLIDGTALLFLTVYFIITLSDLECDYINATTCCSRLNTWVLPDIVMHSALCVVLLFTWHPFIFLLNLPMMAWHGYRFMSQSSGSIGFYDPTEIHNRQNLKGFMKESMIKLAGHLFFFFIYLYCLISTLIS